MNFALKVVTSRSNLIYLVQAEEKYCKLPAWYYVQVEKLKLPILKEAAKLGANLLNFGKILYSGWGENPPEDIKQKIQEEYS